MAKTNISHKKTITEKITIKDARISEDGSKITYLLDDAEITEDILGFTEIFAGKLVNFSIGEKEEEDMV